MLPENDTRGKTMTERPILTIGHSNHPLGKFLALVEGARVSHDRRCAVETGLALCAALQS